MMDHISQGTGRPLGGDQIKINLSGLFWSNKRFSVAARLDIIFSSELVGADHD